jgi:hypothetical protein
MSTALFTDLYEFTIAQLSGFLRSEACPGEPLVHLFMNEGKDVRPLADITEIRETFLQELKRIPPTMRGLMKENYKVTINRAE